MKKKALTLLLIFLLSLAGCAAPAPEPTEDPDLLRTEKYAALYRSAMEALVAEPELTLHITTQKVTTVNDFPVVENEEQALIYQKHNPDNPVVHLSRKISMGNYAFNASEFYYNGVCYLNVNSTGFYQAIPAETYLLSCIPRVVLDPSLYTEALTEETEDGVLLRFIKGTNAEDWILPNISDFAFSEGSAFFDKTDTLQSVSYTIRYLNGPYPVQYTVTVDYEITSTNWDLPTFEDYRQISDLQVPILLEKATLQLLALENITAHSKQTMNSEAGSILWEFRSDVDVYGKAKEQAALIKQTILTSDYANNKEDLYWSQELYLDGQYHMTAQKGEDIFSDTIPPQQIRDNCSALLLQGLLSAQDITGGAIAESDGLYTITLNPTAVFGDQLCRNACEVLFDYPELLKQLATSERVDKLEAYITVDKYTGLIAAAGYDYQVTHSVDIVSYKLICQTEQTFTLPSSTAYSTIKDAQNS